MSGFSIASGRGEYDTNKKEKQKREDEKKKEEEKLDLALELLASAFKRRVWEGVRKGRGKRVRRILTIGETGSDGFVIAQIRNSEESCHCIWGN